MRASQVGCVIKEQRSLWPRASLSGSLKCEEHRDIELKLVAMQRSSDLGAIMDQNVGRTEVTLL